MATPGTADDLADGLAFLDALRSDDSVRHPALADRVQALLVEQATGIDLSDR